MHAFRSQLDNVEREVKEHSTILKQILKTLKSLEHSARTEKSHTPVSSITTTFAVTPSSELTSEFSASFMETPSTSKGGESIPSCGTNSSMETATPFAYLPSNMFPVTDDTDKKESDIATGVQKTANVHFLEPVELHLNDIFEDESECEDFADQPIASSYKHIDTPVLNASQRQKVSAAGASELLSKLVSPTDTFNKAAAARQFSKPIAKPASVKMSKQDKSSLPPKRTVPSVAAAKLPLRAAPAPAKSPPVITTDILLRLPPQPAHLPRRPTGGNILDSHEVFRRKMTRKLQTDSAEQLRKQFSSVQLHSLTPPDARTLHAAPFNASTNPHSSSSPTKPTPNKASPTKSSPKSTTNSTIFNTSTTTSISAASINSGDTYSTPPDQKTSISDPSSPVPTTRFIKRTSPEPATTKPTAGATFHTPKVLRSRRDAPVAKSSLLVRSSANSRSTTSNSTSTDAVVSDRRKTAAAANAAIAFATAEANKVISELQAKNQGKVLRGGSKGDSGDSKSSEYEGKTARKADDAAAPVVKVADVEPDPSTATTPAGSPTPHSHIAKSPRRSPKNIQHSPVYTRHADQWSTTRPLSAAKQALMLMQSPTAGGTRRRSISGASSGRGSNSSISAKNSPYTMSGEKTSVMNSEEHTIPVTDYPPPAPPSTPTLPHTTTNNMLTPIVSNSPYTNYHMDSYSKYAHIMETPATPAPTPDTGSTTEEFLLNNNQQPDTPDRDNWNSTGEQYPFAPSPRALPIPFPVTPTGQSDSIYSVLRATPGAIEVDHSDTDSPVTCKITRQNATVGNEEECYSPYSSSAVGASARYSTISPMTGTLNDTTIAEPSMTPVSYSNTTADDSYTYTTPASAMGSMCLDFTTPTDHYSTNTNNSDNINTKIITPVTVTSSSPAYDDSAANSDLFSSSITRNRSTSNPSHRYGTHNNTSRVTFAPVTTELECSTSTTTMQENPIESRMPIAGLHRSMTIRTQINNITTDGADTADRMTMEPDTPLPAPSPFAAVKVSIDESPFSPAAFPTTTATSTTTILRSCSTYKGTPRPRSRSSASAASDLEDSMETYETNESEDNGDQSGGGSVVDSGLGISVTVYDSVDDSSDSEVQGTASVQITDPTLVQPEQEHHEAVNYTALMDSLIYDYFAQGLNGEVEGEGDNTSDAARENTGGNEGEEEEHESVTPREQKGEWTEHWSTAPSPGDITDLFDTCGGLSDSAYHAYITMGEYMQQHEQENEEDEGLAERVEEGHHGSDSEGNDGSSDEGSKSVMVYDDTRSPGYSTMYAQLYPEAVESTGTGDGGDNSSEATHSSPTVDQVSTSMDQSQGMDTPTADSSVTSPSPRARATTATDSANATATDTDTIPATDDYPEVCVRRAPMAEPAVPEEEASILYSPDRPDNPVQGRARTHARHSSGSFDRDWNVDKETDTDMANTSMTTNSNDTSNSSYDADPTTAASTDTTNMIREDKMGATESGKEVHGMMKDDDEKGVEGAVENEGKGEDQGEDEGEWQGVEGWHSARKKRANSRAAQKEKEKQA